MNQNEVVVRAKIAVDSTELRALREETAKWGGGAAGGGGSSGGPRPSGAGGSGGPPGPPPVPGSRDDDVTAVTHLPPPPVPGGGIGATPPGGGVVAGASPYGGPTGNDGSGGGRFVRVASFPPTPPGFEDMSPEDELAFDRRVDANYKRDRERNRKRITAGAGFISNTASTATGIALGSSIIGFLTGAAERWQETDKALGALDRRFADLDRSAGNFASKMGVVRAEAAGLLETLGAQTNSVDLGQARMGVGFARTTGTDPSATMRFLGTGSRLGGSKLDSTDMARVYGQAKLAGQGDGMLPEFLDSLTSIMQQQFQTTGTAGLPIAQMLMNIPGIMFGDDPRAKGMGAVSTLHSMQGMLSGRTGPDMKVTMLRSMGFGREGGPEYLDAMERLESGALDPRNLVDLVRYFRKSGLSADEATMRLRGAASASGMSLKTLRTGLHNVMSDSGFSALEGNLDSSSILDLMGDAGVGMMSDEDRAAFKKAGWSGTGAGATVASQHRQRQMDDMTAAVGPQVLRSIMDLTSSAANIGKLLNELTQAFTGKGLLEALNEVTANIKEMSAAAAEFARKHSGDIEVMGFGEGDVDRLIQTMKAPGVKGYADSLGRGLLNHLASPYPGAPPAYPGTPTLGAK